MIVMTAEKIKMLREATGFTQSDLAKKLNITRSSVNAWEMGISVPSTPLLAEIALLFNVSTDFLLGIKSNQSIDVGDLSEEEINLIYNMVNHFRNNKL